IGDFASLRRRAGVGDAAAGAGGAFVVVAAGDAVVADGAVGLVGVGAEAGVDVADRVVTLVAVGTVDAVAAKVRAGARVAKAGDGWGESGAVLIVVDAAAVLAKYRVDRARPGRVGGALLAAGRGSIADQIDDGARSTARGSSSKSGAVVDQGNAPV